MEERVIKRLRGWRLTVGGDDHQGWLPPGAAQPRPEPVREVTFNLEILFDGHGWFLVFDSDDPELHGDTWHQSIEDAERQAKVDFGIEPSQWQSAS
jgi:hypothetical protein